VSKQANASTDATPRSLKDAAYGFAKAGESSAAKARFIFEQVPGFLDDIPTEIKSELVAGFQLRKHELDGDKYYKLSDGGNYIPLEGKPTVETGVICMNINAAMSYSPQEFGKMRERDPALHGIVKPFRDRFSTYVSDRMSDLKTAIRRIANEGKARERAANKGFREAVTAVFDSLDKRVKTAKDRGDTEADPVKYRVARDAFWKAYDA
jgi:hypothetical protein